MAPSKSHLGEFEVLVLLAALRLGRKAYGMAIRDEIERHSGREVARAAVYVTLKRLERKGLVRTEKEDADAGPGVPRRFASVTPEGIELLRQNRQVLNSLWTGLAVLEGAE
ncbi:MAG: PadR family transcriptional regulator [Longimicrobiales bacterium]